MSARAAFFGQSNGRQSSEDDRLMDLFRNRNELKKEFAELQSEKIKLTAQLKSREGDLARMQQMFGQLEQLLIEPEWARSVMVMYQLRGLGLHCTRKIARFAEQIKQQHEKKRYNTAVSKWQARVAEDIAAVEKIERGLTQQVFELEEEIRQQKQNLDDMSGIQRLFRKRGLRSRIAQLTQDVQGLELQTLAYRNDIETIKAGQPPDVQGLLPGEKRSINLMILAYAQQLFVDFDDDELVCLVTEATAKSAGATRYGDDQACEDLLCRLLRSSNRVRNGSDIATHLNRRARLISEGAVYEDANDPVPLPGSVSTLFRFDGNDVIRTSAADMLGQNLWGLSEVMSR